MPPATRSKSIRPHHFPLALAGGLWLLCSLTTACAGFRGMIMDLKNDELLGESSPGIQDGTWIPVTGVAAPPAVDDRNTADDRWRLLVFFLPT